MWTKYLIHQWKYCPQKLLSLVVLASVGIGGICMDFCLMKASNPFPKEKKSELILTRALWVSDLQVHSLKLRTQKAEYLITCLAPCSSPSSAPYSSKCPLHGKLSTFRAGSIPSGRLSSWWALPSVMLTRACCSHPCKPFLHSSASLKSTCARGANTNIFYRKTCLSSNVSPASS